MIFTKIKRRCGHEEQIGIAGFSGNVREVPAEYQTEVHSHIKSAENKLCLPCLKKLSPEERKQEVQTRA